MPQTVLQKKRQKIFFPPTSASKNKILLTFLQLLDYFTINTACRHSIESHSIFVRRSVNQQPKKNCEFLNFSHEKTPFRWHYCLLLFIGFSLFCQLCRVVSVPYVVADDLAF